MPNGWPTSSLSSVVPYAIDQGTQLVTRCTGSSSAQNTFSRRNTDFVFGERPRRSATGRWHDALDREDLESARLALLRAVLSGTGRPGGHRWAFNTVRRADPNMPREVRDALRWMQAHTLPVSRLAEPAVMRRVLDTTTPRLDGQPSAGSVASKRRLVLFNAAEYAVELGLLTANPIPGVRWKAPRVAVAIDRRTVVNPVQARTCSPPCGRRDAAGRGSWRSSG